VRRLSGILVFRTVSIHGFVVYFSTPRAVWFFRFWKIQHVLRAALDCGLESRSSLSRCGGDISSRLLATTDLGHEHGLQQSQFSSMAGPVRKMLHGSVVGGQNGTEPVAGGA